MTGREGAESPQRPYVGQEAHECKRRAENPELPVAERQVWATLAVAAELHIIRKTQRRK